MGQTLVNVNEDSQSENAGMYSAGHYSSGDVHYVGGDLEGVESRAFPGVAAGCLQ